MRIAKYIAACGVCSRRKAEELVNEGLITINNHKVSDLSTKVDVDKDEVRYRRKPLVLEKKFYYLLNKPIGYVCTNDDPFAEKKTIDLIPDKGRLYTVGRLDKPSEGLIVLTNDGDLAKIMTHPSYELEKKYRVTVKGHVSQRKLDYIVSDGISIEGVNYRVLDARIKKQVPGGFMINFTLNEGKNREIRKICQFLDLQVKRLRRYEIAGITIGKLPPGAWRPMTQAEVRFLKKLDK
ncbi:pseudouridine synthase [Lentisphaera profundi]|uniref:Pseudouridine synthase n=1 Tax=Lentisphaera profundi TaxID=1658616 RepID=A0ABY7VV24_9BACT|nr:pseudouridine synthase [Lentisphaera profundi]WDE97139.1 pseudouridine synthase [Lentisphaera profundi]